MLLTAAPQLAGLLPSEWMAVFCLAAAVVPSVFLSRKAGFDTFGPLHLICGYFALTMAIRGLFVISSMPGLIAFAPDDLVSRALALATLGILGIQAGYYLSAGKRLARRWGLPDYLQSESEVPASRLLAAAACGFLAMAAFAWVTGGQSPTEEAVLGSAGLFWLVPLFYVVPFALYLLVLNHEGEEWRMRDIVFAAVLLALIFAFEMVRGSKGWGMRPLYYAMVLYHYRRRCIGIIKAALLGVTAFLAAAYLLLTQRVFDYDFAASGELLQRLLATPEQFFGVLISRFYGLDSLMVCMRMVESSGHYFWGSSFRELFYWFIPRALWAGKPYSFSYQFAVPFSDYTGYANDAFVTPSFFGELYLNFGVCGILFGSVAFGIVARAVYEWLIVDRANRRCQLLYAVILLHMIFLVEAPIAVHLALACSEILPLVLLLWLAQGKQSELPAPVIAVPQP